MTLRQQSDTTVNPERESSSSPSTIAPPVVVRDMPWWPHVSRTYFWGFALGGICGFAVGRVL